VLWLPPKTHLVIELYVPTPLYYLPVI
jgi:hypothetical protein